MISWNTNAQTCLSQSTGNWNSAARWLCDGVNRLPACGDTIRIQSAHEITVTNQYNFSGCGSTMALDVTGTLTFTNGNKIDLPCGSLLSLQSGGTVRKSGSGGGSSTLISICGTTVWSAGGTNPLTGPIAYGGFVLPIELLSFDVEALDGHTVLSWRTAAEIDNDFFTLCYSHDAIQWEHLHEVAGAGNSAVELDYRLQIPRTFAGRTLFRLDQTDFDGKVCSVGIAELKGGPNLALESSWSVHPNPSSGTVTVQLDMPDDVQRISLYSMKGQLLTQWSDFPSSLFNFDANSLGIESGNYLLLVDYGDAVKHHKFAIVR